MTPPEPLTMRDVLREARCWWWCRLADASFLAGEMLQRGANWIAPKPRDEGAAEVRGDSDLMSKPMKGHGK